MRGRVRRALWEGQEGVIWQGPRRRPCRIAVRAAPGEEEEGIRMGVLGRGREVAWIINISCSLRRLVGVVVGSNRMMGMRVAAQ